MSPFQYDAQAVSAHFDGAGQAYFVLGDGTVRGPGLERRQAHKGAALCSVPHPSGRGVLTGGDDGRVCWTDAESCTEVYAGGSRWVDAIDASPASGLIAFAVGRDLHVCDAGDPAFARSFRHERSVAAVAFEPKGRRLAAATYGGAMLWYARIADQKPQTLKWAGSHIGIAWSPNGKFLVSAMQENTLHGWRLSDGKDMKMGGYPSKVKSLVFFADGLMLATSGAAGAVVWPFAGANGPMGKEASEVGYQEGAEVVLVAAAPGERVIAAGLADGRVWTTDLRSGRTVAVEAGAGARVSALAMSGDSRRIAFGDEGGRAGVIELDG
ncbi:WD40 repeat domain-containing protein [Caulobacter sp. S45]|uniref:WD40 repeat domain-containing protein n=1 Tax=Caulobacter sp. S45 TaxID=1641861 RepID=UPI00131D0DF6|nr:WD40 repeat domain-containing protein [Caulobacter sp. S45]